MKKSKLLTIFLLLVLIVSSLTVSIFASDTESNENAAKESFVDKSKFYYDLEPEGATSGTFKIVRNNHSNVSTLTSSGNSYMLIQPKTDGATSPTDYFELVLSSSYKFSEKTADYITFDFDVATDSAFIEGMTLMFMGRTEADGAASGIRMVFKNLDSGFALTTSSGTVLVPLGNKTNEWVHITFVVEINHDNPKNSPLHFYANGVHTYTLPAGFIGDTATPSIFNAIRLQAFTTANSKASQTMLLDNFNLRFIKGNDSTAEGTLAKFVLEPTNSIDNWSNSIWNSDYVLPMTKYVAFIGDSYYESFEEALDAATEADTITLMKPITEKQNIEKKINVDTVGMAFAFESQTLLATENENILSFDTGEVTVTWNLNDGTSITEVYTSSQVPTYKGEFLTPVVKTFTFDGTVVAKINEGWSNIRGGDAVELSAVTTSNCSFYQCFKVSDALFLSIDSSNKVTEYTTAAQFKTAASAGNSMTFEVLKDFTLESTVILRGNEVINLNNCEILLEMETHMFQFTAGSSLVVNGNGKLNKTSTKSQVFIIAKGTGASVTVNDTEVYSGAVLLNQKDGVVTFNNCTLEMGGATSNSMFALTGDGANVNPVININGGSIIFNPSTNRAFNLAARCTANVNDCTIECKAAVFNSDATSTINVTASSINTVKVSNSTSTPNVNLGLGVKLTFTTKTNFNIPEGAILAFNNSSYEYVVTDNYVNVTWCAGETVVKEIWQTGSIPVPGIEVSDALDILNQSRTDLTRFYYFHTYEVSEDTEFTAITKCVVEVLFNLNIYNNIDINIYVPVSENGATVTAIEFNGESLSLSKLEQMSIGEVSYYVLKRGGISPALAGTELSLAVKFELNEEEYSISTVTSVVDYCASIIEAGPVFYSEKLIQLAADLIRYCDKAAVYFEKQSDDSYENIKKYKELYGELATDVNEIISTGDIEGLIGKFRSARLILDSAPAVLFELETGFNGRIIIRYIYNGEEKADTYTIINGKIGYGNKIYVPCSISSFDSPIRIEYSDGTLIGTYSVSTYCSAIKGLDPVLDGLLNALYAYCKSTEAYVG